MDILLIKSAANHVVDKGMQCQIPKHLAIGLTGTLIEISEYAIGDGDMHQRVYETLINTLWDFYSKGLIKQAQQKTLTIVQNNVMHFVDKLILHIEELNKVT